MGFELRAEDLSSCSSASNLQLSCRISPKERLICSPSHGVVMTLKQLALRFLALFLSVLLCNVSQFAAAQNTASAPQTSSSAQDQSSQSANTPAEQQSNQAPDARSGPARYDPAQAPLAPVPTKRPAETNATPPDAPSEVQRAQQAQPAQSTPQPAPAQSEPVNPLGTATAQQGATRGGVASRPAGEAIAPAKQRQVHSVLIKLGLLAAGAVAVGTVVGLTRGTSSVPPGAAR